MPWVQTPLEPGNEPRQPLLPSEPVSAPAGRGHYSEVLGCRERGNEGRAGGPTSGTASGHLTSYFYPSLVFLVIVSPLNPSFYFDFNETYSDSTSPPQQYQGYMRNRLPPSRSEAKGMGLDGGGDSFVDASSIRLGLIAFVRIALEPPTVLPSLLYRRGGGGSASQETCPRSHSLKVLGLRFHARGLSAPEPRTLQEGWRETPTLCA